MEGTEIGGPQPAAAAFSFLARAGEAETGCGDRQRFELELEFVHCLANPGYLNWLAQNRYFEDAEFLSYLQYMQYWRQPQYAKFVVYPHSLYFLELLLTPEFRAKIANPAYKELVHTQQFFYWQHARANRVREKAESLQAAAAGTHPTAGSFLICVFHCMRLSVPVCDEQPGGSRSEREMADG